MAVSRVMKSNLGQNAYSRILRFGGFIGVLGTGAWLYHERRKQQQRIGAILDDMNEQLELQKKLLKRKVSIFDDAVKAAVSAHPNIKSVKPVGILLILEAEEEEGEAKKEGTNANETNQ